MGSLATRGILYDVGSNYLPGQLTREFWHRGGAQRDMHVIAHELGCNAVLLFGTDLARLADGARLALREGLVVWLQPRLIDGVLEDVAAHLADTAAIAQDLLEEAPGRVVLSIGCELSLFMQGILPGESYEERTQALIAGRSAPQERDTRLNDALRALRDVALRRFAGPLTYSAGDWEDVDWGPFAIVGLDSYLSAHNAARYEHHLVGKKRWGKPVVVTEFGCCCFQGADARGATGMMVIESDQPPRLTPGLVRDEEVQAAYLRRSLSIFERCQLDGAFVYGFSEPGNLRTDDPLTDLDMAGFGVVSVRRAATPKQMEEWVPKRGFHALRALYTADDPQA